MNPADLKKLLNDLHKQKLTPQQAMKKLETLPFENLDFAKVDHHRELRSGMPEVIYCPGKTVAQIKKIIQSMNRAGHSVLATKLSKEIFQKLKSFLPKNSEYNEAAQTLVIEKKKVREKKRFDHHHQRRDLRHPYCRRGFRHSSIVGKQNRNPF